MFPFDDVIMLQPCWGLIDSLVAFDQKDFVLNRQQAIISDIGDPIYRCMCMCMPPSPEVICLQDCFRHLNYNEITACILYGRIPNLFKFCCVHSQF